MSEWLKGVFSGGVSLARVNPVGIVLMILAVVLVIVAGPVSGRWPKDKRAGMAIAFKLIGLLVCAFGAGIAIL